ncbi:major facilitator superfamily transporter [Aureobasidium pullulans]|uniref:Major facilitator superfamily transporter n=1 Tax=Aureobasidium pullulans TaxID=5580 RepID=A0A4S9CJF1_AURPU|nr:major facilitator superfamily transporter [Aureobasidium pullulans]
MFEPHDKEKELHATPEELPEVEIGEVKDVKNADAALDFLRHEGEGVEMTAEDEKRLVRKIDWMIMPLMWCCYVAQYLDKTLINYAAVMGLYEDANITKADFSNLAWIFYVSYLAFEFPHGYGMQRFPTAKYLGIMVWYKKNEQPPRTGIWYLGTGTGTIIGSLLSYAFQHVNSASLYSWQILFLVVGLLTICIGITVTLIFPDNPMTSRLSHQEKIWAIERLRENQTGIENKHFKSNQVAECFMDPQTWLLSLITISSSVPNGAVSSFQATLIKGFGYDSKQTALLQIPGGACSVVSILIATYLAGKFDQRGLNVVTLLIPGILGGALMAFLPEDNKAGKLIGNYLTNCIGASLPLMYSWVGANYAGHTKKVTMNAILLISFCLGNIIGPLTFRAEDAPEYIPAKITIIVTCATAVVLTLILRAYYIWENKRRDKVVEETRMGHKADIEFADVTDRKNKEFRYRL